MVVSMNITTLRRNRQYADILSIIHKFIPDAIIAGGAIRDLCHEKTVKDIDIYVPYDALCKGSTYGPADSEFWEKIFILDFNEDYIENVNGEDSYEGKNHISTVFEIKADGVLYNIIMVDKPPINYVMEYFDIGLCKAYFDGKRFHLSADFMHDSKNGTLTITANKNIKQCEFDHMYKWHIQKLQKKYPNFVIIVPQRFENMYKHFIENKMG